MYRMEELRNKSDAELKKIIDKNIHSPKFMSLFPYHNASPVIINYLFKKTFLPKIINKDSAKYVLKFLVIPKNLSSKIIDSIIKLEEINLINYLLKKKNFPNIDNSYILTLLCILPIKTSLRNTTIPILLDIYDYIYDTSFTDIEKAYDLCNKKYKKYLNIDSVKKIFDSWNFEISQQDEKKSDIIKLFRTLLIRSI